MDTINHIEPSPGFENRNFLCWSGVPFDTALRSCFRCGLVHTSVRDGSGRTELGKCNPIRFSVFEDLDFFAATIGWRLYVTIVEWKWGVSKL